MCTGGKVSGKPTVGQGKTDQPSPGCGHSDPRHKALSTLSLGQMY